MGPPPPLWKNIPTQVKIVGGLVIVVAVLIAIVAITHGAGSPNSVSSTGTTTSEPTTIAEVPIIVAPTSTTTRVTVITTTTTLPPTTKASTTTTTQATTTTSVATAKLCGAPSNPYGYNFCRRGDVITQPASDVCSYFNCIASFWNGSGYMVECVDDMYSLSGGKAGACSHHGGEQQPVYSGP